MRKDPAIEEIRQTRKEISREFETTDAFLDHYRDLEESYESRIVRHGKQMEKPKIRT